MPHRPAIEVITPLLALVVVFAIPIPIVIAALRHRRHVIELKLRTLMDLSARGSPVPAELLLGTPKPRTNTDLRIGLVLASTGIGALLFAFTLPEHPAWGVGLLPLFAGLGFLITWKIAKLESTAGSGG